MSDLVRNHIGLREIARRAEAVAELVVEIEVDVDLAVAGAIERAGRRARKTAGGAHPAGKERQLRQRIFFSGIREDLRPGVLRVGEDGRHERPHLVVRGASSDGALLRGVVADIAPEKLKRIDAEEIGDDEDHNDRADASSARPAHPDRPAAAVALQNRRQGRRCRRSRAYLRRWSSAFFPATASRSLTPCRRRNGLRRIPLRGGARPLAPILERYPSLRASAASTRSINSASSWVRIWSSFSCSAAISISDFRFTS